ncbi:kallikrein-7-like isoform X2 [Pygocentrus nattereri]|uniref:kallikrein-7-like isoform X2 n=1 Tax=Pygocentrus nattereri TaxID=42514 RepID=UPI0008148C24|nr:kallikrein-7-like isoform X2 [Pygocentrus nattereri]
MRRWTSNMKSCFVLLALWAGSTRVLSVQLVAGDCKSALDQHHAILTIPGDNTGHCSGLLLNKGWIITAAQCNMTDLEVILGQSSKKNGERFKIQQIKVFRDSKGAHDLMLLKVDENAASKFPAVRLPDHNTCKPPANKAAVQLFGWTGEAFSFKHNTTLPPLLQCGTVTVAECGSMSRYGDHLREKMKAYSYQTLLCASHPTDACDYTTAHMSGQTLN